MDSRSRSSKKLSAKSLTGDEGKGKSANDKEVGAAVRTEASVVSKPAASGRESGMSGLNVELPMPSFDAEPMLAKPEQRTSAHSTGKDNHHRHQHDEENIPTEAPHHDGIGNDDNGNDKEEEEGKDKQYNENGKDHVVGHDHDNDNVDDDDDDDDDDKPQENDTAAMGANLVTIEQNTPQAFRRGSWDEIESSFQPLPTTIEIHTEDIIDGMDEDDIDVDMDDSNSNDNNGDPNNDCGKKDDSNDDMIDNGRPEFQSIGMRKQQGSSRDPTPTTGLFKELAIASTLLPPRGMRRKSSNKSNKAPKASITTSESEDDNDDGDDEKKYYSTTDSNDELAVHSGDSTDGASEFSLRPSRTRLRSRFSRKRSSKRTIASNDSADGNGNVDRPNGNAGFDQGETSGENSTPGDSFDHSQPRFMGAIRRISWHRNKTNNGNASGEDSEMDLNGIIADSDDDGCTVDDENIQTDADNQHRKNEANQSLSQTEHTPARRTLVQRLKGMPAKDKVADDSGTKDSAMLGSFSEHYRLPRQLLPPRQQRAGRKENESTNAASSQPTIVAQPGPTGQSAPVSNSGTSVANVRKTVAEVFRVPSWTNRNNKGQNFGGASTDDESSSNRPPKAGGKLVRTRSNDNVEALTRPTLARQNSWFNNHSSMDGEADNEPSRGSRRRTSIKMVLRKAFSSYDSDDDLDKEESLETKVSDTIRRLSTPTIDMAAIQQAALCRYDSDGEANRDAPNRSRAPSPAHFGSRAPSPANRRSRAPSPANRAASPANDELTKEEWRAFQQSLRQGGLMSSRASIQKHLQGVVKERDTVRRDSLSKNKAGYCQQSWNAEQATKDYGNNIANCISPHHAALTKEMREEEARILRIPAKKTIHQQEDGDTGKKLGGGTGGKDNPSNGLDIHQRPPSGMTQQKEQQEQPQPQAKPPNDATSRSKRATAGTIGETLKSMQRKTAEKLSKIKPVRPPTAPRRLGSGIGNGTGDGVP